MFSSIFNGKYQLFKMEMTSDYKEKSRISERNICRSTQMSSQKYVDAQ